jgi:hypothetical protein
LLLFRCIFNLYSWNSEKIVYEKCKAFALLCFAEASTIKWGFWAFYLACKWTRRRCGHFQFIPPNVEGMFRLSVNVNRQKLILQTMWTDTKIYVNRCKQTWKLMRIGVNQKHSLVSVTLKNMWTGVNRQKILCEPVSTGARNYVNRCEPWFALTGSLDMIHHAYCQWLP